MKALRLNPKVTIKHCWGGEKDGRLDGSKQQATYFFLIFIVPCGEKKRTDRLINSSQEGQMVTICCEKEIMN